MIKSKYARPLMPEKLEQAARKIYIVHQRGDKNRGDQIEKILAPHPKPDRDDIMLRAQRLSLDGLPKDSPPTKPARTPVESPSPAARHNGATKGGKTHLGVAKTREKAHVKPTPSKKSKKLPF